MKSKTAIKCAIDIATLIPKTPKSNRFSFYVRRHKNSDENEINSNIGEY